MKTGIITKVAGPLVIADGMRDANMFDVVRVSSQRLIGEIIEMHGDKASIQVYEETSGLKPGDPVYATGSPLCINLGPGILSNIFDGIENPLDLIAASAGAFIPRGLRPFPLDENKLWDVTVTAKVGDELHGGGCG